MQKLQAVFIVLVAIGGGLVNYVHTQASLNSLDSDLKKLKMKYLPAEYAGRNFTMDDAKRLLRQKCQNAGVEKADIYEDLEKAAVELMECANDIANLTVVMQEIEEARPTGELDTVFQKYCEKLPRAQRCLHDFNSQLILCLKDEERTENAVLMRIINSLLGFICYKNGNQIALFIAEEGPECIEANKEHIANCMNASFAAYLPTKGDDISTQLELPDLVMSAKHCINFYDFEECVLGYLEQCNEITPANVIESMFRYVKNETKCKSHMERKKVIGERQRNNGSTSMRSGGLVVTLIAGAVVVGRWSMAGAFKLIL